MIPPERRCGRISAARQQAPVLPPPACLTAPPYLLLSSPRSFPHTIETLGAMVIVAPASAIKATDISP